MRETEALHGKVGTLPHGSLRSGEARGDASGELFAGLPLAPLGFVSVVAASSLSWDQLLPPCTRWRLGSRPPQPRRLSVPLNPTINPPSLVILVSGSALHQSHGKALLPRRHSSHHPASTGLPQGQPPCCSPGPVPCSSHRLPRAPTACSALCCSPALPLRCGEGLGCATCEPFAPLGMWAPAGAAQCCQGYKH